MRGVGGIVVAALGELADAAPGHVPEVVQRRAGRGSGRAVHPADRVDEHAVAQRGLAEREPLDPEHGGHGVEDQGAGDDDVGPARLEARHLGAAGSGAVTDELVDDTGQLGRRELEAVVRPQRLGAGGRVGDVGDRFGGPRGGDGDLEAVLVDRPLEVAEDAPHVLPAVGDRSRRDVAAREEAVRQADRADLEAACRERLAALAEQQLRRSAADVDEEDPPVEDGHRLEHAEVDQAGLLGAGDDLDVDARLGAGAVEEGLGVDRFTYGARGHGAQRGVVAVDDAAHPAQAGDAPVDGLGGHHLHVAATVPESDDLLLAGQRLEAIAAGGTGHDEVEAVGADVERGEHGRRARPRRARSQSSSRALQASIPPSTPSRKLAIFSKPLPTTSSVDEASPTHQRGLDRLVEVARARLWRPRGACCRRRRG